MIIPASIRSDHKHVGTNGVMEMPFLVRYRWRYPILLAAGLLFCLSSVVTAESLWVDGFKGYGTGSARFSVGDIVRISIDSGSTLKYTSSSVDSERVTLEFSGGEADALFAFLPDAASGGTVSLKGEESLSLNTAISARIVDIDEAGALFLRGERRTTLRGVTQRLSISGWVSPASVVRGGSVEMDDIADLDLIYTSLIESSAKVIGTEDLVTPPVPQAPPVVTAPGAPGETSAVETAADVSVPVPPVPPPAASGIVLSEDRRRELLVEYVNRFLEFVFSGN